MRGGTRRSGLLASNVFLLRREVAAVFPAAMSYILQGYPVGLARASAIDIAL